MIVDKMRYHSEGSVISARHRGGKEKILLDQHSIRFYHISVTSTDLEIAAELSPLRSRHAGWIILGLTYWPATLGGTLLSYLARITTSDQKQHIAAAQL